MHRNRKARRKGRTRKVMIVKRKMRLRRKVMRAMGKR